MSSFDQPPLSTSTTLSVASSAAFGFCWKVANLPSHDGCQSPREIEPSFDHLFGSSSTFSSPVSPSRQKTIGFSLSASCFA